MPPSIARSAGRAGAGHEGAGMGIRISKLAGGRWYAIVEREGRRWAHRAASRQAAKDWADDKWTEAAADVEPLPIADLIVARQALRILPPGVTLLDAAKAVARPPSATVAEAAAAFQADKTAARLRPRSLYQLSYALARLKPRHGAAQLDAVATSELAATLAALKIGPSARNNLLRAWSGFWRWSIRAGLGTRNPVDGITRAVEDRHPPGILTPEAAGRLLACAMVRAASSGRDLAPMLALGFFAGLRTEEALRLEWTAIDRAQGFIRVSAAQAKTREGRLVPIVPPLDLWLDRWTARAGRIVDMSPSTVSRERDAIRDLFGGSWPANAPRHSFASYRLAATGDSARTAHELGHESTDMLYRHYRALVTPEAAAAFFALAPAEILRRFCDESGTALLPVSPPESTPDETRHTSATRAVG